jgi:hypothetical protein
MSSARNKLRLDVTKPGEMGVHWWTTGQVGQHFGVSAKTVCQWIDRGLLIGIRLPGSKDRRVHPSAIAKFEEEQGYTRARGAKRAGE